MGAPRADLLNRRGALHAAIVIVPFRRPRGFDTVGAAVTLYSVRWALLAPTYSTAVAPSAPTYSTAGALPAPTHSTAGALSAPTYSTAGALSTPTYAIAGAAAHQAPARWHEGGGIHTGSRRQS